MNNVYEMYIHKSIFLISILLAIYCFTLIYYKKFDKNPKAKGLISIIEKMAITPKVGIFLIHIENKKYLLIDAYNQVELKCLSDQDAVSEN